MVHYNKVYLDVSIVVKFLGQQGPSRKFSTQVQCHVKYDKQARPKKSKPNVNQWGLTKKCSNLNCIKINRVLQHEK